MVKEWWKSTKTVERFESKYVKARPDECWMWAAWLDLDGYGVLAIAQYPHRAHRLALARSLNRDLLPGEQCLHSCDRRACINPGHLRVGNNAENMADRDQRERLAWGERQGGSKLTSDDVIKIREMFSSKTQQAIADEFGVCRATISHIKNGRNWKRLPEESKND